MTTTSQLEGWMQYDSTFVGVFPLDKIPHMKAKASAFIINTHTNNLPGQHWIAIRTLWDRAWIFDPMAAHPPPPALCHHLLLYCNVAFLYVCKVAAQPPSTQTCGQHCIYFLHHYAPARSEHAVLDYINKLDE